jgi:hypothetical protein
MMPQNTIRRSLIRVRMLIFTGSHNPLNGAGFPQEQSLGVGGMFGEMKHVSQV